MNPRGYSVANHWRAIGEETVEPAAREPFVAQTNVEHLDGVGDGASVNTPERLEKSGIKKSVHMIVERKKLNVLRSHGCRHDLWRDLLAGSKLRPASDEGQLALFDTIKHLDLVRRGETKRDGAFFQFVGSINN